ncbi:hypothetical protein ACSBR2_007059 [Camellia fascicularis]
MWNWTPLAPGKFKVNFDVATKRGSTEAVVALVVRDSVGNLVDGVTKKIHISFSLQGETLACRWSYIVAQDYSPSNVVIDGDKQSVIHLSVSKSVLPWDCGALFNDIKRIVAQSSFSLRWSPRFSNKVAHWIANACLHD